jgi:hypothetical protein
VTPAESVPTYCLFERPGVHRSAQIDALLKTFAAHEAVSVIIEGSAADGSEFALHGARQAHVIAPGCPCCLGNLTMRVTLARVLRQEAPARLVLALIEASHRERVLAWLQSPPYDRLLHIEHPESVPDGP